jgi:hypothetical protein
LRREALDQAGERGGPRVSCYNEGGLQRCTGFSVMGGRCSRGGCAGA